MSDIRLSSAARTALIALVIFVDEASNPALRDRLGVDIEKPVREELESAGLITSQKGLRNAIFHTLTEEGWLRGRTELGEVPPVGAKPIHRMLYGTLNVIDAYMRDHNLKMVDVFHLPEEPKQAVPVEEQVRSAYRELAKRFGDLVSLARLRGKLPGVEHDELDKALVQMSRRKEIQLEPFANRLALPPEAKRAAVRVGGEDMHMIAFMRR